MNAMFLLTLTHTTFLNYFHKQRKKADKPECDQGQISPIIIHDRGDLSWMIFSHTCRTHFKVDSRNNCRFKCFPDTVTLWFLVLFTHNSGNLGISTSPVHQWIRVIKCKIRTGPDSVLLAETGSRGAWPKNASSPLVPPTGNACPVCWRLRWWKKKRLVWGVWPAMEEEDGWSLNNEQGRSWYLSALQFR